MPSGKGVLILFVASLAILGVAIAVVVLEMREGEQFPWGTHLVTIPAVFLFGLVAGWALSQRQAAEEKARQELASDDD
jgi:fluoride ion exporter CrcB/FEX